MRKLQIMSGEAIKNQNKRVLVWVTILLTECFGLLEEKMEQELLIANDVYMKCGVHIGTKFSTKYMAPYIYKIRPDGLAVLNVESIDAKLKEAIQFLTQYNPEDIIVVARRENAWKPAKLLSKYTGIRVYTGRYMPGILTNSKLENFTEGKVIIVTDPWPDKNAMKDAKSVGMKVIALCDTNNETNGVDYIIPCNNKGRQSLGLVYYILTRDYMNAKGLGKLDVEVDIFTDDPENPEAQTQSSQSEI